MKNGELFLARLLQSCIHHIAKGAEEFLQDSTASALLCQETYEVNAANKETTKLRVWRAARGKGIDSPAGPAGKPFPVLSFVVRLHPTIPTTTRYETPSAAPYKPAQKVLLVASARDKAGSQIQGDANAEQGQCMKGEN